jgi:hypothetical protein
MPEEKKERWEITIAYESDCETAVDCAEKYLDMGFEPFAIYNENIYFKRKVIP